MYPAIVCGVFAVLSVAAGSGISPVPPPHHGIPIEEAEQDYACLNCHNGAHATKIDYCTNDCRFGSPHPVFVSYPPLGKQEAFHSPADLSRQGIRLPQGMVTCVSCHDLRSIDRHHLIINNGGSRLCLTCHIK